MNQSKEIKKYILANVSKHPQDIVATVAQHFQISRTTVHRHLQNLIKADQITKQGTTRQAVYFLNSEKNRNLKFKLNKDLDEFSLYSKNFAQLFQDLPKHINDTCDYVMTEMINNAKDHSNGKWLITKCHWHSNKLILEVKDDGIGIFENLNTKLHLDDKREAILQITKGKVTTDPMHHTGEGLFFTSRVVDHLTIKSNGLYFVKDNRIQDWGIYSNNHEKGTTIIMEIDFDTKQDLVKLFESHQAKDDFSFDKTDIIVELSKFEWETMISRSQAKRILKGLEKFKYVTLDFKGVRLVGQGFSDEVFRVFCNKHPTVQFKYINANKDVTFMIERAKQTPR